MKPITRETIIDRRQSGIRWGAVFAGTALAIGLWVLLQSLGMGIGLIAIDVEHAANLRGIGIATTIWALVAPIIAVFLGAMLAGRLAAASERKVGATHGMVVWALSSVLAVLAIVWMVGAIAMGAARVGGVALSARGGDFSDRFDSTEEAPQPGGSAEAGRSAARASHVALEATQAFGQVLLFLGISMLVGLGAAAAGGAVGARRYRTALSQRPAEPPVVPPTPPTVIDPDTLP